MRKFLSAWMLPIAIVLGISLYLLYHYSPGLHPWGGPLHVAASEGQRLVIALLLFFQFVKLSPHDIQLRKWHWGALLLQVSAFLLLAAAVAFTAPGAGRMLLECAMLCMICPTAAAAGVITDRLGGDLAGTVSYLVVINVAATFLIPLVIPMVNPSSTLGFWAYVGHIALKVFPILILPGLLAWLIRYTTHKLQRRLVRWASHSFYVWGVGLTLAMVLSTRALVLSHLGPAAVAGIVLVSAFCCFLQFFAGRWLGRSARRKEGAPGKDQAKADSITAGQTLGQKNTGFLIWLGYNYMTPVTSVAGGLYAIWQNLFNSWELYQKEHGK
ncbi:MAG: transporter [Bacteroidales bacterium]|nr:transporter [Bacteroidales bacterium]